MLSNNLLAYENTFLAGIRTSGIFAGLSVLLWNKNWNFFAGFVLLLCIIQHLISTFIFYKVAVKQRQQKNLLIITPIIQALLLACVLVLLLIGVSRDLMKNRKTGSQSK